jgi:hypothetical protein
VTLELLALFFGLLALAGVWIYEQRAQQVRLYRK